MKRWFLIIGIILIVGLILVWVYILLNGPPSRDEIFGAFSFEETIIDGVVEPVVVEPVVAFDANPLRQLTLRQVAGYSEVFLSTTSDPLIYFVEAGTGHVFSLSPELQDSEVRLSNITLPLTTLATVAIDGSFAAIVSGEGLTVVTLPKAGTELSQYEIDEPVEDIHATLDAQLLYTTKTSSGLVIKKFDPVTKNTVTLATVPFSQANILWGDFASSTHMAYPKTAHQLEGFGYEISSQGLERLPLSGFGLSVTAGSAGLVYRTQSNNVYQTRLFDSFSEESIVLDRSYVPEKCAFRKIGLGLICGYDARQDNDIDNRWYKGVASYADAIWAVDFISNPPSNLVVEASVVSGREIDVINPDTSFGGEYFFFQNKNDRTLWLYEFPNIIE